jgi:hypothetical protein
MEEDVKVEDQSDPASLANDADDPLSTKGSWKSIEHPCNSCDFTASTRVDLAEHRRATHKERGCKKCDFKTGDRFVLHDHLAEAHGIRNAHQCDICGFSAKERRLLTTHTNQGRDSPIFQNFS